MGDDRWRVERLVRRRQERIGTRVLIKFKALDAISRAYGRGCLCIEWPD